MEVRRVDLANWALRRSPKFTTERERERERERESVCVYVCVFECICA